MIGWNAVDHQVGLKYIKQKELDELARIAKPAQSIRKGIIDRILEMKKINGQRYFLVKWKNRGLDKATWEIDNNAVVQEFLASELGR